MQDLWEHPLGKHLVVLLIVKLFAVYLIWWFFFRPVTPEQPVTADQVGAEIVGTHPIESTAASQSPIATKESYK